MSTANSKYCVLQPGSDDDGILLTTAAADAMKLYSFILQCSLQVVQLPLAEVTFGGG